MSSTGPDHSSLQPRYVSASEISQHEFCSVAWYYQKEKYPRSKISSKRMAMGRDRHRKLEKSYLSLTLTVRIMVIALVIVVSAILFLTV
jgi:CRISPR/Cas system-associated exonuclease Cas4 (RecB family)